MFEHIEIAEAIYKGVAPSKNIQRAESDCAIFVRKQKGGGSASLFNPDNLCAVKRKRINSGHQIDVPTMLIFKTKNHCVCLPCNDIHTCKDIYIYIYI